MQHLISKAHESFIKFIYASVMVEDNRARRILEDIARFEYRHMVWLMTDARREGHSFNMDFDEREIKKLEVNTEGELLSVLIEDLENNIKTYSDEKETPTIARLINDDKHFLYLVRGLELDDREITAFNQSRELPGVELKDDAKAALVFFLMEETFKEYELITIYSYLKVHSDKVVASCAFTDLAYDSIYHLKRFAELASKMGVLTMPKPIPHDKYQNIGVVEFLKENIEEEMDAEKQCLILAEKIGNEELSDFLLFISRQEVYHGELLQRALDAVKGE